MKLVLAGTAVVLALGAAGTAGTLSLTSASDAVVAPVVAENGAAEPGRDVAGADDDDSYRTTVRADYAVAEDPVAVHAAPSVGAAVTGTLRADAGQITSTGRQATVEGAEWMEVTVPGATTGWVLAGGLVRL